MSMYKIIYGRIHFSICILLAIGSNGVCVHEFARYAVGSIVFMLERAPCTVFIVKTALCGNLVGVKRGKQ